MVLVSFTLLARLMCRTAHLKNSPSPLMELSCSRFTVFLNWPLLLELFVSVFKGFGTLLEGVCSTHSGEVIQLVALLAPFPVGWTIAPFFMSSCSSTVSTRLWSLGGCLSSLGSSSSLEFFLSMSWLLSYPGYLLSSFWGSYVMYLQWCVFHLSCVC